MQSVTTVLFPLSVIKTRQMAIENASPGLSVRSVHRLIADHAQSESNLVTALMYRHHNLLSEPAIAGSAEVKSDNIASLTTIE